MPHQKIKTIAFFFSVVLVSLGAAYGLAVWTGPSGTPPTGNPEPPINVSLNPQVKTGRVSAREFLDYNNPVYYLKNEAGESKLQGKLSFGSSLQTSADPVVNIYAPAGSHENAFDPDNPDTPRTNTGLLNADLFPF